MQSRPGIFAFVLLPPEGGGLLLLGRKSFSSKEKIKNMGGVVFVLALFLSLSFEGEDSPLPKRGSVLRPLLSILLRILLGRYQTVAVYPVFGIKPLPPRYQTVAAPCPVSLFWASMTVNEGGMGFSGDSNQTLGCFW